MDQNRNNALSQTTISCHSICVRVPENATDCNKGRDRRRRTEATTIDCIAPIVESAPVDSVPQAKRLDDQQERVPVHVGDVQLPIRAHGWHRAPCNPAEVDLVLQTGGTDVYERSAGDWQNGTCVRRRWGQLHTYSGAGCRIHDGAVAAHPPCRDVRHVERISGNPERVAQDGQRLANLRLACKRVVLAR